FVGSSSIRLWGNVEKDFPGFTVLNRGFGGSHLEHATQYADRIIVPYQPKGIVVYAGTNDIHDGETPDEVARDFKEFVQAIHARMPDAKIAYVSIAPTLDRWGE